MTPRISLSLVEARRIILNRYFSFRKTGDQTSTEAENPVTRAIHDSGYTQIDSISRVERAHHHALYNRVADYRPDLLEQAVASRHVFEYWSHAAAYLPIHSYRYCLPLMKRMRESHLYGMRVDQKLTDRVLARIREEGPLMARQFTRETPGEGSATKDGPVSHRPDPKKSVHKSPTLPEESAPGCH